MTSSAHAGVSTGVRVIPLPWGAWSRGNRRAGVRAAVRLSGPRSCG